jgi:hypothetical protein
VWIRPALALAALAVVVATASSAAAQTDPWAKGAQWMSLRAGYAKATGDDAGNGWGGYGFGYSRMLNAKWSLGFYAHHEVVGHRSGSLQLEFPFTAELVRRYRWKTALRPYLGLGGGMFFYGTYRDGADHISPRPGGYLVWGADTPVAERQLLGVDARVAIVDGDVARVSPVFGAEESSMLHWSVKLNWSFAY